MGMPGPLAALIIGAFATYPGGILLGSRGTVKLLWPGRLNLGPACCAGGGGFGGRWDGVPHLAMLLFAGIEDELDCDEDEGGLAMV